MRIGLPGHDLAIHRLGYSAEQWLIVSIIATALRDLFGKYDKSEDKECPVGRWQIDAAFYFLSPQFDWHCECIGVEPSPFLKHSGALDYILTMVK